MASIEYIKGSDGSGNAEIATVQNTRAPGASTIVVDTVVGINPDGFMGSMGTPHTFTDPITSEIITVISEATAVDFSGHVDGADLEIDDIAPGYVDNGSEVGDIIMIRPTTQYADQLAEVLEVSHNDDGTLKDDTVDTDQLVDEAVTFAKLLSTIFGAEVTTYTNPGTAGGTNTFFYVNLGGIKLFWGTTANQVSNNSAPGYGITFPTSFFTTMKTLIAAGANMTADTRQYVSVGSFNNATATLVFNAPNGAATEAATVFAIGT